VTYRFCLLIAALLLVSSPWATPAAAHESRPAYLDIREMHPGRYEVLWKRPMKGDLAFGLSVHWPASCRDAAPGTARAVPGAVVERRLIDCGAGTLFGQRLAIDGLARTRTDVLVRVESLDGGVQTNLLKPATPSMVIEGPRPALAVSTDYLVLGVEHILLGIDHLLFVLGLTLIVRGATLLVTTITAFTVAHSMTLALATLGYVNIPQAPVEAVIALSILFLASELARQSQGEAGLTTRAPWLVAFAFGLLHGFGFAGALADVGLPQSDIPLALLTFNLGVEVGQLLFVAGVLGLLRIGRRLTAAPPRWLRTMPAYAIGSLASFWLIERVTAFG
jgi:hydrogenase/urease accessory protein HupE